MAKVTLTARSVAALETEKTQEDHWDLLLPGFGVRVSRTGRKTYFVRYRQNGAQRRMKLGSHPALSLADARGQAREKIAAAESGEDPQAEKAARRSDDASFGALARAVLDMKAASTREATRTERQRMLEAELLPAWESRAADSIRRHDVVQVVDGIVKRGSPVMANRVLALVKLIYNQALEDGHPLIESNPAHRLKPRGEEGTRRRFLKCPEIRTVWTAAEVESPVMRGIFRVALLTAQRIGSVAAMRWRDIDGAHVWTIPAEAFKGKRPHAVPLSSEALVVLDTLRPLSGDMEYVFPGRSDGKAGHVNSTNKALQRLQKRTELPRWTAHDFRRTFRTHATRSRNPAHKDDPAGLGIAPHVADAVLGHKEASLGFDRYTGEPERYLLSEKREALARWGAFVREVVEGAG